MLVLSRRHGEGVFLPTLGIEIRILKTRGGRVHIGIEAPKEVPIRRSETTSVEDSMEDGADPVRRILACIEESSHEAEPAADVRRPKAPLAGIGVLQNRVHETQAKYLVA